MKQFTIMEHYGEGIPAANKAKFPLEVEFSDGDGVVTFQFERPEDYVIFLGAPLSLITEMIVKEPGETVRFTAETFKRMN